MRNIMLFLKRMTYFNEMIRDTVDESIIAYGDYYYEDMDPETGKSTGLIISAEHYWELKKENMEEAFEKSDIKKWYNSMESEKEYRDALREAEEQYRQSRVLKLIKAEEIM